MVKITKAVENEDEQMPVQIQKLRTLYIMDILKERTDEEHLLNAADLSEILKQEYDIHADRKTIYSEIQTLIEYGMDIIQVKGRVSGYYVGSREFEVPEVKLLVDAVLSSKFITQKKSDELAAKLETLVSAHEAQRLKHQIFVGKRPKTENETIYYNVGFIHDATYQNKQISFRYMEWNVKKELQFRKKGALYEVSPWALTWDDENYYLVAYEEKSGKMKHYRVDKIHNITILSKERLGKEVFDAFDLVEFQKKTFGMYGGEDTQMRIRCKNELAGVVIDRFGQDVKMIPVDDKEFYFVADISVSPQFFGWLAGIGPGMKIIGPANVAEEYKNYLTKILERYEED